MWYAVAFAAFGLVVVGAFAFGFVIGAAAASVSGTTRIDHDAIVYAEGFADGQAAARG